MQPTPCVPKGRLKPWSASLCSPAGTATLLIFFATAAGAGIITANFGRFRSALRFVGKPVYVRPKWAVRTGSAQRVIHPFLMRAADDLLAHRSFPDTVAFEKIGHLGGDHRVLSHIAYLCEPPVEFVRLLAPGLLEHSYHKFGGTCVVRAVSSNRADWIIWANLCRLTSCRYILQSQSKRKG